MRAAVESLAVLALLTLMQCVLFEMCQVALPTGEDIPWPVLVFMLLNAVWVSALAVHAELLLAVTSLASLVLVKPTLALLFWYPPVGVAVLSGLAVYLLSMQLCYRAAEVLRDA